MVHKKGKWVFSLVFVSQKKSTVKKTWTVRTKRNVTKRKVPNPNTSPLIALSEVKNQVKIEHLLLQSVKNIHSGFRVKTFIVLNWFNPRICRSMRCFYHFKCMICQTEIYGSESLIYHAKRQGSVESCIFIWDNRLLFWLLQTFSFHR